ncbi:MAG: glycerophosphodiester phosphodiesterase [Pseudomonadota bacterium]
MSLAFPRLVGHRGLAAHAPENTLAGFRAAHDAGIKAVEFDAKLTGDGVPILMHDDTLDRTTDGQGNVREFALEELGHRDAGGWFGPAFAGEVIPTLAEALDLCGDLDLQVNIEIKPCPGRAKETAAEVLRVAEDMWQDAWPTPLISSFEPDCLIVAREQTPQWPRGYLIHDMPGDWNAQMAAIDPATLNLGDARWSSADWAKYRDTGLPILVYTVNDPDRARQLIDLGVTSVISDDPALLAPALGIDLK